MVKSLTTDKLEKADKVAKGGLDAQDDYDVEDDGGEMLKLM